MRRTPAMACVDLINADALTIRTVQVRGERQAKGLACLDEGPAERMRLRADVCDVLRAASAVVATRAQIMVFRFHEIG